MDAFDDTPADRAPMPDPVKIAAPWMDERSHDMLREFFRVGLKSRCVLVEAPRAQAILIDLDRGDATRRLHDARLRWPNVPIIELSVNHTNEALFVRKPLRARGMARALLSVRRRLRLSDDPVAESVCTAPPAAPVAASVAALEDKSTSQLVGLAQDVPPDDPGAWARAWYAPDDFLQGHLQRAAAQADADGRAVALSGVWGTWIVPPGNGVVRVDMADRALRSLCVVGLSDSEVRLRPADVDAAADGTRRDALLWKVALWTARGRVPHGTPLDQPVYLKHWPDLNALAPLPHALRIAALWLDHPQPLLELAGHLGLPQRNVFAVYTACAALGLAGPARRAADVLVGAPELTPSGMQALIARLSGRLGLGPTAESAI
ncbi:hypothetical protein [Denitromonas iodatirespirans]|uniref:Uncharacterized protein n=1 Tax=Denitromonas iodatirespirans TaxID=2795389 RepID=A0A944HAP8_DENI1|nr:hypothetical protein [Denitromonas iodatirespirans]MBT0963685.1 hypothetical protein [Denitromonas iodatirespirans]